EALPNPLARSVKKDIVFFDAGIEFVPCAKDHCYEPRAEWPATDLCEEHHYELEELQDAVRDKFVFGEE
ncbi:MAG: hypothetical protein ACXABY_29110, partial [Candidatus Thorarchaeota archaeon]